MNGLLARILFECGCRAAVPSRKVGLASCKLHEDGSSETGFWGKRGRGSALHSIARPALKS